MTGYADCNRANWEERAPAYSEMVEPREWRLADRPWRIPQTYTLLAVKRT